MTTTFNSKISRDFSRAAQTYDAHAALQRKVADRLFSSFKPKDGLILDIGCGTGYFHELLRKNKIYQPLMQTDIAIAMCETAATYASPPEYGGTYTCAADMHNLPFSNGSFANIFSSMTIQWSEDKTKVFSEIKRTLQDEGTFALSIVAAGSLQQLHETFVASGYAPPIHNFASESEIALGLTNCGLEINEIRTETITFYFKDIYAIISSIKGVGASYKGTQKGGIKGKGYFAALGKTYSDKFANEEGLPLSWNIIYVTGKK